MKKTHSSRSGSPTETITRYETDFNSFTRLDACNGTSAELSHRKRANQMAESI